MEDGLQTRDVGAVSKIGRQIEKPLKVGGNHMRGRDGAFADCSKYSFGIEARQDVQRMPGMQQEQ
ncbi:hypothetical protein GCM10020255_044350 [Rhodococcus baikonurensis]